MEENKNILFVIIIFFSIVTFIHLGRPEIQQWDEGLYAMRARSILQFGDFIDQTKHSPGGLYSSTYPPLSVWAIAGSIKIFGMSEFSVRLYSAVCSILALIVLFLLLNKFFDSDQSLFGTIAGASTTVWYFFSRQAMTELPLTLFFLICLYSVIYIHETDDKRKIRNQSLIFAFSLACALMTKIIISFLPLLFVLIYLLDKKTVNKRIPLIIASLLGIAIALPWHIFMAVKHGSAFISAFYAPHLYTAVENSGARIGVFYYLNQIILANPLLILAIIFSVCIFFNKKLKQMISEKDGFLILICLVWFISVFTVFSIAPTKHLHYLLYMIPPALILSVKMFNSMNDYIKSSKVKFITISILFLGTIWSMSFDLRNEMKDLFHIDYLPYKSIIWLIFLIALFSLTLFLKSEKQNVIFKKIFVRLNFMIIIILVLRLMILNNINAQKFTAGGKQMGYALNESIEKSIVYMYHQRDPSDSINAQLAWYSNGWTIGWQKGKTVINIPMPEKGISIKNLRKADEYSEEYLIYLVPDDESLGRFVVSELMESRQFISQKGSYLLFSKMKKNRYLGKLI